MQRRPTRYRPPPPRKRKEACPAPPPPPPEPTPEERALLDLREVVAALGLDSEGDAATLAARVRSYSDERTRARREFIRRELGMDPGALACRRRGAETPAEAAAWQLMLPGPPRGEEAGWDLLERETPPWGHEFDPWVALEAEAGRVQQMLQGPPKGEEAGWDLLERETPPWDRVCDPRVAHEAEQGAAPRRVERVMTRTTARADSVLVSLVGPGEAARARERLRGHGLLELEGLFATAARGDEDLMGWEDVPPPPPARRPGDLCVVQPRRPPPAAAAEFDPFAPGR